MYVQSHHEDILLILAKILFNSTPEPSVHSCSHPVVHAQPRDTY